jgi:hypothetical protein
MMITRKSTSTFLLVLMGSMDCITTLIGIMYFGAVECNPLLIGLVSTNLPAFTVVKLTTTVFVVLIFRQAEKILMQTKDHNSRAFTGTHKLLKVAYVGAIVFLAIVVANNINVLINAL